jgi:hypothetical protein
MKASELRVGNLLDTKEHKNVIVSAIDSVDSEIGYYWRLHYFGYWKINKFQPIPLTEEWLLKFGFKKVSTNFENDFLIIHGNIKTGTFDFLLNIPNTTRYNVSVIKFVHQLQNLYFSLFGEELRLNTKNNEIS